MTFSYQGFHQETGTFTGEAETGQLVVLQADGSAAKAAEDDAFVGVCVSRQGKVLGVQLCGAVECGYTGTAPVPGFSPLCAASESAVKVSESGGRNLLILKVDTKAQKVVFLL